MAAASGPSTWQRFCPQSAAHDPRLAAIAAELERPEWVVAIAAGEIERRYPEALCARLRELGVAGCFAAAAEPDPAGSLLTEWHVTSLLAALARRSASLGVSLGVTGVAMLPIYIAGTPAQLRAASDAVLGGGSAAMLLTEWNHGSDLMANETVAERGILDAAGAFVPIGPHEPASHYRLSGEKCFINEGSRAAVLVTLARTRPRADDPPGALGASSGFSLFMLERAGAGAALRTVERHRTLPVPASDIAWLALEGVVVPAAALLGREGEGFYVVQRALSISRGGVAPLAAGLATRARELAETHAGTRVLYGAPIAALGAIAEHLARMEGLERVVNCVAIKSAAMVNLRGQGAAYYTAVAKLAACQLCEEAVTEGRRVMGARGLVESSSYERVVRDALLFAVFDGSRHLMLDQIQLRLAEMATAAGLSGLDVLGSLQAAYGAPPAELVAIARKGGRPLVLPVAEAAAALAALPGRVPLDLLARAAEALIAVTRAVIESGRWKASQALRFGLAEALALLEALFAFVELHDPDRRPRVAPPVAELSPRDGLLHAFTVGWLGSAVVARIRELALYNDQPIDPALAAAERALLAGHEGVRAALFAETRGVQPGGLA
jgi:alkylation response protein AidB-like acyl-CoA dehydrogenase